MSLVFTQLAQDSFQRANENPLSDGGNWTDGFGGASSLAIVNNQCVAPNDDESGLAYYTGIIWPNNQWAQVEVANEDLFGAEIYLRNGGYRFVLDAGTVLPVSNWTALFGCESTPDNVLIPSPGTYEPPNVGDVIRFVVVGSTIYFYLNGNLVLSGIDNNNTAPFGGRVGLALTGVFDPHNPAFINFSGGSVAEFTPGRFTFLTRSTPAIGATQYDVIDSGDSKKVGTVFWDNVVARAWAFNLQDNMPFITAGSVDASEISTFASALPTPAGIVTTYDPTVPASTRFQFIPSVRRNVDEPMGGSILTKVHAGRNRIHRERVVG